MIHPSYKLPRLRKNMNFSHFDETVNETVNPIRSEPQRPPRSKAMKIVSRNFTTSVLALFPSSVIIIPKSGPLLHAKLHLSRSKKFLTQSLSFENLNFKLPARPPPPSPFFILYHKNKALYFESLEFYARGV